MIFQKIKEKKKSIIIIGIILIVLILIAGYITSWKYDFLTHDWGKEDNILIADYYEIKPTKHIAEAYISDDYSNLSEADLETLIMAKEVIDKVITPSMTDFEKEVAIYRYVITKKPSQDHLAIVHSTEDLYTPHGVINGTESVCVGYATTFRLFMEMLGIECRVCHNSGRGHAWNMVKLEDEWYHVDCSMGAKIGNYQYLNVIDGVMYTYEEWNTRFFPVAHGIKYNYAVQNSYVVSANKYEIPSLIKEKADNGLIAFSINFGLSVDPNNDIEVKELVDYTGKVLQTKEGYLDKYFYYNWIWDDETGYTLLYYVYQYMEIPEKEEYIFEDYKIYEIVNDAIN